MRLDDIQDVLIALGSLSRLKFPIESAHSLKALLPAGAVRARLDSSRIDLKAVIDAVPAYYFPITSLENLAAKAQTFFRDHEHRIGIPALVAPTVKRVAGALRYPVKNVEQIRDATRSLGIASVPYRGGRYTIDQILAQFPQRLFPIHNATELYRIGRRLSRGR